MAVNALTGDTLEVRIVGKVDLQVVMTVLHYQILEVPPDTPLKDVCDEFNTVLTNEDDGTISKYFSCLASDYDGDFTEIQRIAPLRMISYRYDPFASGGGVAAVALPPGTSVALTKRAEASGPHGIGGVRMPAVPVTFNAAGLLDPISYGAYDDLCESLKTTVTLPLEAVLEPVILNRASPESSYVVYDVFRQDNIRTMSRRVVGRGI